MAAATDDKREFRTATEEAGSQYGREVNGVFQQWPYMASVTVELNSGPTETSVTLRAAAGAETPVGAVRHAWEKMQATIALAAADQPAVVEAPDGPR